MQAGGMVYSGLVAMDAVLRSEVVYAVYPLSPCWKRKRHEVGTSGFS
jgi:hypothetical protein